MPNPTLASAPPGTPSLEHLADKGKVTHRMLLSPLPFRVGRSKSAHWTISSAQVSKDHAEIYHADGEYCIRDLNSTNGTFVNGVRVEKSRLQDGDIIHFAKSEFLFHCEFSRPQGIATDPMSTSQPLTSFIRARRSMLDLLEGRCVTAVFQPIVSIDTGLPVGYEALGRGNYPSLSRSPAELFRLADECLLSIELSRAFRQAAADQVRELPDNKYVFFNTHPSELTHPALVCDLKRFREHLHEDQHPVVEIHESAVPDLETMRQIQRQMHDLGILVAFDDFGAGQSRLVELSDAPPDFIKLDRGLISGIDHAPAREEVVRSLCNIIIGLGVRIIAEGIETAEEAQVCRSLGCHFGQGYYYGKAQPVNDLKEV